MKGVHKRMGIPLPNPEELSELIKIFNEATERLQRSNESLQRKVGELTRELEEKNRELHRKNRLAILGELSACLAHEIRNPLGGIELYTNLIKRELAKGTPVEVIISYIDRVLAGVRNLNMVVQDMLIFATTIEPRRKPVSIEAVVEEAIELARGTLEDKRIQLRRKYTSNGAPIWCDPDMMARVFLNVILNAVDAMPDSNGCLTIEVHLEGQSVVITFSDNGRGLSEQALKRLFTPFFSEKARGVGLGLTIANKIVQGHGGKIDAANNDPQPGATFRIILPRGI
jgi:signal transduction histidine kinase